jgi:capsular exopolysaccharide synthesis family protein
VPVLGIIRRSELDNNLAVLNKPKSSIAESFRSLRSSLQFIYKEQGVKGAKSVLITSSVSGEGKTFCSINISSVFALSGKKTVLVGLDLRKPKIFGDFNINNDIGVVNFLIQDAEITEIIQKTHEDCLDVITSGPIPPNPAELLMGDRMNLLITELKKEYDFIVLDSPPLGLVSDALELTKFVDATIYLTRQNYTKRGMFTVINDKYRTGEITNISIVLNFFEGKARYGYGYDYGYGYGYGAYGTGYHENEKKRGWFQRIKDFFKWSKQ